MTAPRKRVYIVRIEVEVPVYADDVAEARDMAEYYSREEFAEDRAKLTPFLLTADSPVAQQWRNVYPWGGDGNSIGDILNAEQKAAKP